MFVYCFEYRLFLIIFYDIASGSELSYYLFDVAVKNLASSGLAHSFS